MCLACLRTAGGPRRNDGSSHANVACLKGPARRCHLRLSRLPAATTSLTSWPRSRTRARGAAAGIRWPGCWPWDRGGDRRVQVVRRDRAVGRRCRPGGPWRCWARHADRRRSPPSAARSPWSAPTFSTGSSVPGCGPGPCRPAAGWSSLSTARPSAARGTRRGRPRTWSRPSRTGSARSSARSPRTRNPMRSPQCGSC
jgi:hypothetical protein